MKKYLVTEKVKKTKAAFFDSVEVGDVINVENSDEKGKLLVSKNSEEGILLTDNKFEKGLENLKVEEVKESKDVKEVTDSEEVECYGCIIEAIQADLADVNEELKTASGKRKRYLKKWKTRITAELRKEILISELK